MSDLTNERIAQLIVWSGSDTAKALHELLRHRAAVAVDEERVKKVVADEMQEWIDRDGPVTLPEEVAAIAARAAEQLATAAAAALSESDRIRLRNIVDLLRKQPVCWDMEAALLDRILGATK